MQALQQAVRGGTVSSASRVFSRGRRKRIATNASVQDSRIHRIRRDSVVHLLDFGCLDD